MFKKKNNEEKEEKEASVTTLKVWDKEAHVEKRLAQRPLEFYIRHYRMNLKVALGLSFFSFLISLITGVIIQTQQENHDFYITSTDGKIVEHNLSQNDVEEIQEAFSELKEQNNE